MEEPSNEAGGAIVCKLRILGLVFLQLFAEDFFFQNFPLSYGQNAGVFVFANFNFAVHYFYHGAAGTSFT